MIDIKVDRIATAIEYLKSIGAVHRQQDVATKMGATSSTMSRALGGDEKYLTEKFIQRFNMAFDCIFNESWLLGEDGEMLKEPINQEANGDNNTQVAGNANHVNSTAAMQLALSEISEMRKLIQEQVRNNQEQFNKFISIIERLTN